MGQMAESTTVKVSKETVRKLSALQESLHTKSMDETIEVLLKKRRKEVLDSVLGAGAGRIGSFTEEDRLEDRS